MLDAICFLRCARATRIREAALKDSNARATFQRLNSRAQVRRCREVREQPLQHRSTQVTGIAETHNVQTGLGRDSTNFRLYSIALVLRRGHARAQCERYICDLSDGITASLF